MGTHRPSYLTGQEEEAGAQTPLAMLGGSSLVWLSGWVGGGQKTLTGQIWPLEDALGTQGWKVIQEEVNITQYCGTTWALVGSYLHWAVVWLFGPYYGGWVGWYTG